VSAETLRTDLFAIARLCCIHRSRAPLPVKVVGLTTARRSPIAPEWGTAQEGGVAELDASIWVGLLAPRGLPKPLVGRIYDELSKVMDAPDLRDRFALTGAETVKMSPADFHARIKSDAIRYRRVAQSANIKIE